MLNNSFNIGKYLEQRRFCKKRSERMYSIVDFGEVQENTNEYIITEKKGLLEKEEYFSTEFS
jgi:hypothetical protein